ncbi:hypothetical protein [Sulfuritalea hydrogenivorans]|uniref:Helix-turn-helix domain-containing protein n=1 Tax=Sulfuritalea hydrogenivorans sk43H TaxID=1223802 RepID=W0SFB2_9PROT|nr:hypothetical protein [Sulfuritalea hydrogenivorans]BAO29652.1 hypothetical protein SUTH_01860 [Sulfuritalea hydrogenivorans sk43H]
MSTKIHESSLVTLSSRYGGTLLPLSLAAQEIGIKLRTAHNQISKGVFPIPTILRDRRRYVLAEDLANYIDNLRQTRTGAIPCHR